MIEVMSNHKQSNSAFVWHFMSKSFRIFLGASILIKAFVSYFEIRSLNNTANCTATLISQFVLTQGIIQCFNVTVLVASLFVNTWQAFHFLIDHKETRYRILRIAFTVCSIVLGATFLLMVILTTDRVKRRHYCEAELPAIVQNTKVLIALGYTFIALEFLLEALGITIMLVSSFVSVGKANDSSTTNNNSLRERLNDEHDEYETLHQMTMMMEEEEEG